MADLFDDVWGNDSDVGGGEISHDLKKLREIHNKRGYVDGITHSKDANMQQGFDAGFPQGSKLGAQVGRLVGKLQALDFLYGNEDVDLRDAFKQAQTELQINKILTKSVFNANLDVEGEHEVVAKWDGIVSQFMEKYDVRATKC